MVLDKYRSVGEKILSPVAQKCTNIEPNLLSLISLVLTLTGALLIYFSTVALLLLMAAALLIITGAFFDALDGQVARLSGKANKKGDFLDHALDRFADIAIILAVGFSAYCRVGIAVFAMAGVMLASYMGTQAQAVGVGRIYGGLAARADRLVVIFLALILQFFLIVFTGSVLVLHAWKITALELAMAYFAVGGAVTAIYRFAMIWQRL